MRRYERKYRIEGLSVPEVQAIVRGHPLAFRTEYPDRRVNNVYLDTPELDCLEDNLRGVSHRVKYRLRWYGTEPPTKTTFEIKAKDAELGWKKTFRQSSFDPWNIESTETLPMLHPTLRNTYDRSYFRSFDGRYRLTIDWNLRFQDERHGGTFGVPAEDPAIIVEVKYDAHLDHSYDEVGQYIPFRWGKNSKYVTGMLLIG